MTPIAPPDVGLHILLKDIRVVAMLTCLRYSCRTVHMLQHAAGEVFGATKDLIAQMQSVQLVAPLGADWYLDRAGVGFIELNKLAISEMSKVWVAAEKIAALT